jgi:hypothetical protein
MKKPTKPRRLQLDLETIRTIDEATLTKVAAGWYYQVFSGPGKLCTNGCDC